jgi:uncharacterized membrane protein
MQIIKRLSIKESSANQWLLLSGGFSCFLLLIRIAATSSLEYSFLTWNLFLAFIPLWIAQLLTKNISWIENRFKLVTILSVWLLFVPNSFYIITDLVHFTRIRTAPKWFDGLMIFSFAWNGILAGILSLGRVETILRLRWKKQFSIFFVFAVMWLCAFGVYIGRYLRFNSWDIITNPFSLMGEIIGMVVHPFHNEYAWGMILCYGVFMTVLYLTLKKIGNTFYEN